MTIPETQLIIWSNQGATSTAQSTHESIRKALSDSSSLAIRDFEMYLQGSYRNTTNIRGDSDVDLVAELQSTWYPNIDRLDESEKRAYENATRSMTYGWNQFRGDVIAALNNHFGADVKPGNRCVKVRENSGRLAADVVVCLEYRIYTRFNTLEDSDYIPGMKFWDLENDRWIINFPKVHYQNGSNKNANGRAKGNYKPTIRMFKNARNRLVRDGLIDESIAPSYFIECLLYNVPDSCFNGSFQTRYIEILGWLTDQFSPNLPNNFLCQNEQDPLFGERPEQWSYTNALTFLIKLFELWKSF